MSAGSSGQSQQGYGKKRGGKTNSKKHRYPAYRTALIADNADRRVIG
jgi:hypothetical protein